MRIGRLIGFGFATICILLGLIFLLSLGSPQNTGKGVNAVMALVLLALGIGVLAITLKFLPTVKIEHTVVRKVDLSGDVSLDEMKCKSCGGSLSADNFTIAGDGGAVVSCPYCGTVYQVTEAPKW